MTNPRKVFLALILLPFVGFADEWIQNHHEPDALKPTDHYGRSRNFDYQKLTLDIDVDVRAKTIKGASIMMFAPMRDGVTSLDLDSKELNIESVAVDNAVAPFQITPDGLTVTLQPPRPTGKPLQVVVRYNGKPRKGIYFYGPDKNYPDTPLQAWTQGEAEDARHWFPTYDYPNDKLNTETIVRVDPEFNVLSNGGLVETKMVGNKKQFHYRLEVPHVSYLVTLVVGKFNVVEDKAGKTPLQYWVPRGYGDRAEAIFGRTPILVSFFEEVTGQPYPYEKYAQVVVHDFVVGGGMENTTATTMDEYLLYPEKDRETWLRPGDSLIAHELAHQWFGDLLTCKSWSHVWLNEGFATYFQSWSVERTRNRDEFLFDLDQNARNVLAATPSPTVRFRYVDTASIFGANVYSRGAWILHMLRMKFGDDLFLRGLRAYVKEFREKNVETADFRQALEKATGADLNQFFQQWVYKGGFLDLKGKWSWDESTKSAIVELEQKPITDTEDQFYYVSLEVEFETKKGTVKRSLPMSEAAAKVAFSLDERPITVRIDPDHDWLRKLDFERTDDELIGDLKSDKPMLVRSDAARALIEKRTPKSVEALGKSLRSDPFWGVRVTAAKALSEMAFQEAWDELLRSQNQPMPQVRAQIAYGLALDNRPSTIQVLEKITQTDSSDDVIAAAAYSLASQRREQSFGLLQKLSERRSHTEMIQGRILNGIAVKGWDKGLPLAKKKVQYGQLKRVRPAAADAIGAIGSYREDKREFLDTLIPLTSDKQVFTRGAAIRALGKLGDPSVTSLVEQLAKSELASNPRSAARSALDQLREGKDTAPKLRELKKTVEELKASQEELKRKVEFIEKSRPKDATSGK